MLSQTRNSIMPNIHTGPVNRTPRTGVAINVPIHVITANV